MASTLSLAGIQTLPAPETRALVLLNVEYNGNIYSWSLFCPPGVELQDFLATAGPLVEAQIDAKEAAWAALTPKTRTIQDPLSNELITVDIQKEEIVRPDVPDYYALRRDNYPPIGDQLDAFWKGPNSPEYTNMLNRIQQVKNQFPKL